MAKPEPERDEDGYLQDETILKVYAPFPVWIRYPAIFACLAYSGTFFLAAFDVVTIPILVFLGFVPVFVLLFYIGVKDDEARANSPDHRPGAYERALEIALEQNRWTKQIRGTEFLDPWVLGFGWKSIVFWPVLLTVPVGLFLLIAYLLSSGVA
ncbi:hypothetical protein NHF40_07340 [Maricaulaceae bacterium EIL42A08]|nr:hypothetical protein [Maricaulaceae bacterium EIL42A08]